MGFAEVLTIVLIVLKYTHVVHITLWQALLPEFIAVGLYIVLPLLTLIFGFSLFKIFNTDKRKAKRARKASQRRADFFGGNDPFFK